MAKETFGQRITNLRKEKGLTQNDIAEKIGVTSQAVSKWENDQATPDIDILIKLSDIFEISLDELLGKEKKITVLNERPSKKDINKMVFRIQVLDAEDGDTVNINLPLALIRVCVNKENGKINLLDGNKNLEGIDFNQLVELVEQGVVGELITVDSKNGDKVRIFVE